MVLRFYDFMDPRFGTLSHITLNRPNYLLCFKNVIKSWNGLFLQEVVLCELILNILIKNLQTTIRSLLEIPSGEDSGRIETS